MFHGAPASAPPPTTPNEKLCIPNRAWYPEGLVDILRHGLLSSCGAWCPDKVQRVDTELSSTGHQHTWQPW